MNATPLPDDHPVMGQLKEAFGEHTFFMDQNGLSVFVEPERGARARWNCPRATRGWC